MLLRRALTEANLDFGLRSRKEKIVSLQARNGAPELHLVCDLCLPSNTVSLTENAPSSVPRYTISANKIRTSP